LLFQYRFFTCRNASDSSSSTTIRSCSPTPSKQTDFALVETVEDCCKQLINEIPAFDISGTEYDVDITSNDLATLVVGPLATINL